MSIRVCGVSEPMGREDEGRLRFIPAKNTNGTSQLPLYHAALVARRKILSRTLSLLPPFRLFVCLFLRVRVSVRFSSRQAIMSEH